MLKGDHFIQIYQKNAYEYHRMIAKEDVENHLLSTIEQLCNHDDKIILDLGSGTGRIPLLLQDKFTKVVALDIQRHMLQHQKQIRNDVKGTWTLLQADMCCVPITNAAVDICIAGWSIGHTRGWYPDTWHKFISTMLEEMTRVTKPGGSLLVMETLGTGAVEPAPPSVELAEYHQYLENDWGFQKTIISTDYQFTSVDQAVEFTQFFFGDELAARIRQNDRRRLPEFTGIWHKRL